MQILCAKSVPDKKEAGETVSGSGALPRLKTLKIKICCINLNTMLIFSAWCRSARFPDTAAAPISATLVAMDKAQWSKDWLPSQAI